MADDRLTDALTSSVYGIERDTLDAMDHWIFTEVPSGKKPHHCLESELLRGPRPLATVLSDLLVWHCALRRKQREHEIYETICSYLDDAEFVRRRRNKILRRLGMESVAAYEQVSGGIPIDERQTLSVFTMAVLIEMFTEDCGIEMPGVLFVHYDSTNGTTRFLHHSTAPRTNDSRCVVLRRIVSGTDRYWEAYATLLDPADESSGHGIAGVTDLHTSADPRFSATHVVPAQHLCRPDVPCSLEREVEQRRVSELDISTLSATQRCMLVGAPAGPSVLSFGGAIYAWTSCRDVVAVSRLPSAVRLASFSSVFTRAFNRAAGRPSSSSAGRMRYLHGFDREDLDAEYSCYLDLPWLEADQRYYTSLGPDGQHEMDGPDSDFHWRSELALVLPLLVVAPRLTDDGTHSFTIHVDAEQGAAIAAGTATGLLVILCMPEQVVLTDLPGLRGCAELQLSHSGSNVSWCFDLSCAKSQAWARRNKSLPVNDELGTALIAYLRDTYDILRRNEEPRGVELRKWGSLFTRVSAH